MIHDTKKTQATLLTLFNRFWLKVLWLSLLSPFPLLAQGEVSGDPAAIPSQARGISGNSAFDFSDLGSVNLLNGNLTFMVPLGISYPVGPSFSYQLALHYNSGAWGHETAECLADADGGGPGQGLTPINFSVPLPDPTSNAGMGWTLSLGRLLQPAEEPLYGTSPLRPAAWTYVSPDGSRHRFDSEIRPGVGPGDAGYTSDGSYMRLRDLCGSTFDDIQCHQKAVDSADGKVRTFINRGTSTAPDWRLAEIRDPFGNVVTVTYQGSDWLITDSQGRSHTVRFADSSYSRILEVEVQAHNLTPGTAVYQFHYAPPAQSTIDRHRYASLLAPTFCVNPMLEDIPNTSEELTADLLTGITRPEGSFFEMSYFPSDLGTGAKSGALQTIRIPTGATYAWKYGVYGFEHYIPPQGFTNGFSPSRFGASSNWGVVEKRRYHDDGTTLTELGTWTYERIAGFRGNPQTGGTGFCFLGNRTVSPDGHATETYFNTLDFGADALFQLENASFTLCDPDDPTAALMTTPPYLSQRMFEDGVLVRSIYLDYEGDGPLAPRFDQDLRVTHRRTVYHDDPGGGQTPHHVDEVFSDFDGLGQFRRTVRSSTFPNDVVKTLFTNYNSTHGHPSEIPSGGEQVIPTASEPWLLRDYTFREVSQGSDRSLERTCFSATTGVLLGRRAVEDQSASLADGPADVLMVYGRDSQGFVTSSTTYGGDNGFVPAGDLCSTTAAESYRTTQIFDHGVLEESRSVDCSGAEITRDVWGTVDPSGLLTNSEDDAGIRTIYRYDLEGRLVCSSRTGEGDVWNRYVFPTVATDVAELETFTCPSAASPCATACAPSAYLTHNRSFFDSLGRQVLEQSRRPLVGGGDWAERATTYDLSGRRARQSVWVTVGTSSLPADPQAAPSGSHTPHHWYRDYDRFDRAGTIESPDRKTRNFTYRGERERVETIAIGQAAIPSQRTEVRDGHGRVVQASEASAGTAVSIHTTYRYDHQDRLAQVCVGDNDTVPSTCPTSGAQKRLFDYDGRGWMSSENHPELGSTANGQMSYTYDANGNVLRRDAPGTPADLTHVYDRAGRVTQVCTETSPDLDCDDPGDRLLEELFYGRDIVGNDRRKGKVVMAKRHNWVRTSESPQADVDVVVTENFTYSQRSGKLSEYRARASDGPAFALEIQAYDDLGNPTSLRYPECLHGACDIGAGVTVGYAYDNGFLSQIPGYVTQLDYHPGGQLATTQHQNGIIDRRSLDNQGWRLGSITVGPSSGADLWSTGAYTYDAAGNILTIGSEQFDYDRTGRLVSSSVRVPSGAFRTQDLSYDIFGNITSIDTTDHGLVTIPVATTSNRLSAASYDARGNVTDLNVASVSRTFAYDPFDRITRQVEANGAQTSYLYTASGERFATLEIESDAASYTVRGPGNEVLTRARRFGSGSLDRQKDYVYAATSLVAVDSAAGRRHVHTDHLGTTRRVTDSSSPVQVVEANTLYPFGGYTDLPAQGSEELLFTGHERDAQDSHPDAALDYMHARYYSAYFGRFLSIDPVLGDVARPQSWNRYAYVLNNPLGLVDPSGESDEPPSGTEDIAGAEVLPQGVESLTDEQRQALLQLTEEQQRAVLQLLADLADPTKLSFPIQLEAPSAEDLEAMSMTLAEQVRAHKEAWQFYPPEMVPPFFQAQSTGKPLLDALLGANLAFTGPHPHSKVIGMVPDSRAGRAGHAGARLAGAVLKGRGKGRGVLNQTPAPPPASRAVPELVVPPRAPKNP